MCFSGWNQGADSPAEEGLGLPQQQAILHSPHQKYSLICYLIYVMKVWEISNDDDS